MGGLIKSAISQLLLRTKVTNAATIKIWRVEVFYLKMWHVEVFYHHRPEEGQVTWMGERESGQKFEALIAAVPFK